MMYEKGMVVRILDVSIGAFTKNKNYVISDYINDGRIITSHPVILYDDNNNRKILRDLDVISLDEIRNKKIKSILK